MEESTSADYENDVFYSNHKVSCNHQNYCFTTHSVPALRHSKFCLQIEFSDFNASNHNIFRRFRGSLHFIYFHEPRHPLPVQRVEEG